MGREEQGVTTDRFMLIPRTLVFLTRGDQVLLLKGAATKRLWAGLYNGVGGHVERNEDVLTSAQREIEEETGLHPEDLWLAGVVVVDTGEGAGICIFVFRGECEFGDPISPREGDLEWVSIERFHRLALVEDLPVLLGRVLSIDRRKAPFFGHYSYDANNKLVIRFTD